MRNIIEQDARQFYYFYNENFKDTYVDEKSLKGQGLDNKLRTKVAFAY